MNSPGEAPGNPPIAAGPAEPGLAPPVTVPPVGRLIAVGNNPEGVAIGTSGTAAVGLKDPDGIALVDLDAGVARKVVSTGGGAPRHLDLAGPDGPALAPLEQTNTVLAVSLTDGAVLTTVLGVGHNPHNAVRTADGTIVVINELGGGVIFIRDGAVVSSLPPGPPQPGWRQWASTPCPRMCVDRACGCTTPARAPRSPRHRWGSS